MKPRWKPKDGERYWHLQGEINAIGFFAIVLRCNRNYEGNAHRNCFKTKKEAKEALRKIEGILKGEKSVS